MAFKNRVVARYLDGRVMKGFTFDFLPNKEGFHLVDSESEKKVSAVAAKDLKAIFFVKTFAGNKERKKRLALGWGRPGGQRLRITFLDGEVLQGTATVYTPGRLGFFVIPADDGSNNERAFVYTAATKSVEVITAETAASPAGARGTR
jgi:hypothetical protein